MIRVNGFAVAGCDISLSRMTGGRETGRWTLYVSVTVLNRTAWISREPRNRHVHYSARGMGWFGGRRK